ATMREVVLVQLALGAVDGSAALGFGMHQHVLGSAVESGGWPGAVRENVYRAIREEGALLNSAATEERGGSPARGAVPETTARIDGQTAVLRGEKTWTTWLPALRFALVSATLSSEPADGSERGETGVGTFLVELGRRDSHRPGPPGPVGRRAARRPARPARRRPAVGHEFAGRPVIAPPRHRTGQGHGDERGRSRDRRSPPDRRRPRFPGRSLGA